MKYGIALFPAKKLQDLANSFRMRYDSHYAWIPPHITVKEPFEVSDDNLPYITAKLREIASNLSPVEIDVYKVDTFSPQSNTIFFKIREHKTLTALYEKLHSEPFEENKKYKFIPHVTIGQDLSKDEVADIVGRLKMKKVEHHEVIDRMQLMYQLENGSWTVYETFRLGE
ncbi:YjcG family protein [Alkalihalophilus lindianensis]|uniref:Putative phosphoesterase RYX56_02340 n=1 Tax=Alkalihalophilus lindianensis TaxID=1630542 RepID=A0ABU3X6Z1_9BACI|nr:YjcG family protein [Alkalihalophilus lindianensis]MDV2683204.1 YjcG family protein [Alkalihalophilus lindianensis]